MTFFQKYPIGSCWSFNRVILEVIEHDKGRMDSAIFFKRIDKNTYTLTLRMCKGSAILESLKRLPKCKEVLYAKNFC